MSAHVRALTAEDLPAAAPVGAAAFGIEISEPAAAARWAQRLGHLLATDPDGSFVAERDGRVIGVAQAMRRERVWCLSLLAVQPGVQSTGAGRQLFERCLDYGARSAAGLIVSSNDPRALRLYGLAGFALRATFDADGVVDRRALPRAEPAVRDAGSGDLEALAAISREIRGAPHTTEIEFALRQGVQLLRIGDRGYAAIHPQRGLWLLVARDEPAAAALLWSALALIDAGERANVRWITGGQDWALRVLLRAGLRVSAYGALCVHGQPGPLRPFIPSAPFA
jgi:predicted N-acetyltransferase YhbS